MSYNLVDIFDFNKDDVNFDLPNKYNNEIICNNIIKNIYQTPKVINKSKIYTINNDNYIDILINDKKLKDIYQQIDDSIVNELKNKNNVWFRKELSEETIKTYYTPIIKNIDNEYYITFKLSENYKLYDENNNSIELDSINELDNIILLLSISNIIFNDSNYYCVLKIHHIKLYKEKISLTEMIKTDNLLNNEIINNLANDSIENDNNEELDIDYDISSRMIINKRKQLNDVYLNAEEASINAHKLRKEAIELAQELEDYESMKSEMN